MSDDFQVPSYSTPGSAAFDIRSPKRIHLDKGECRNIGLGFAAEVPDGHVAVICPRSGVGIKYGLGLRNTVGVIDSDYRGEWNAMIQRDDSDCLDWHINADDNCTLTIDKGDRILQCMIIPVEQVDFVITETLSETDRGTGGYGSTGIK